MPQVISGVYLGNGVYDFVLPGDPRNSTDPVVLNAAASSTYRRTDGDAGTCFYVREPSGWVAK